MSDRWVNTAVFKLNESYIIYLAVADISFLYNIFFIFLLKLVFYLKIETLKNIYVVKLLDFSKIRLIWFKCFKNKGVNRSIQNTTRLVCSGKKIK